MAKNRLKMLEDVPAVLDALGGDEAAAKIVGAEVKAMTNRRYIGTFAANTYAAMIAALNRKNCTAPPTLWDQRGDLRASA